MSFVPRRTPFLCRPSTRSSWHPFISTYLLTGAITLLWVQCEWISPSYILLSLPLALNNSDPSQHSIHPIIRPFLCYSPIWSVVFAVFHYLLLYLGWSLISPPAPLFVLYRNPCCHSATSLGRPLVSILVQIGDRAFSLSSGFNWTESPSYIFLLLPFALLARR